MPVRVARAGRRAGCSRPPQHIRARARPTPRNGSVRSVTLRAAPGADDGRGVRPDATDEELARLLDGCGADLVFVGHTHWPSDRTIGGVRLVNLGAVSNSFLPGPDASYVLLDADADGYRLR